MLCSMGMNYIKFCSVICNRRKTFFNTRIWNCWRGNRRYYQTLHCTICPCSVFRTERQTNCILILFFCALLNKASLTTNKLETDFPGCRVDRNENTGGNLFYGLWPIQRVSCDKSVRKVVITFTPDLGNNELKPPALFRIGRKAALQLR